jgi:hypothetical protein
MPCRGGSKVSRTGREEFWPLSGPRQIALRAVYKSPPATSTAPSPIRNILASQIIAAMHNRTGIQDNALGFVPEGAQWLAVVVRLQDRALNLALPRIRAEAPITQGRPTTLCRCA